MNAKQSDCVFHFVEIILDDLDKRVESSSTAEHENTTRKEYEYIVADPFVKLPLNDDENDDDDEGDDSIENAFMITQKTTTKRPNLITKMPDAPMISTRSLPVTSSKNTRKNIEIKFEEKKLTSGTQKLKVFDEPAASGKFWNFYVAILIAVLGVIVLFAAGCLIYKLSRSRYQLVTTDGKTTRQNAS